MNLDIGGIHKDYGKTPALHGVDLTIHSGELIALLGPSGSGKTTLLRIIAGLDFPKSGHVLFGGEDASHKRVQDRNVGFVFQHYALFKHMSVFDNIAFGLRARPRRERPSEAEIAAASTRCSNWCSCPTRQALSGAALRRPAPAHCFCARPGRRAAPAAAR